jgi:peptidoglycan/LPS O-acetylase OafA/YrhL
LPAGTAPLAWLGRWSLTWYMLHQPAMIGAIAALSTAIARQ